MPNIDVGTIVEITNDLTVKITMVIYDSDSDLPMEYLGETPQGRTHILKARELNAFAIHNPRQVTF